MVRSFAFTTKGRLHSKDIELFLMPTLLADTNLFLWVDLEDPTPQETDFLLKNVFHFHPLSIEDSVTESPSPKVEEYLPKEKDEFSPYLFMVIHAVDYSRKDGVFATSELSFYLGKNFLVTFHSKPLRPVELAGEMCLRNTADIATEPDRVAHTLLDLIVENYKPALDELAMEVAEVEQRALADPGKETLNTILQIRKEVLQLRQIIGPQKEVLGRFVRGEFKLVRSHLIPYYRDVYDGLYNIGELAARYAESLTGVLQVYLNMSSNKTGEIVKLLTVFTVITTPMMLVGTWYGMNFHNMPEIASGKTGYLVALAVTAMSTLATIVYFKIKKWL